MTDIDDLRNLQNRQQVVLAELQHRTRNLLALVQAIARQTVRSTSDTQTFLSNFDDRLRALSRVQALVGSVGEAPVKLRELLETELNAQSGGMEDGKVLIDGPEVSLPAMAAQTLGLAVHELATNAVKYGALCHPEAKLEIRWTINSTFDEDWLELRWSELGVDLAEAPGPRRKGYGSELIERALPYQLNAKTEFQLTPTGVRCMIAVPLPTKPRDRHDEDR